MTTELFVRDSVEWLAEQEDGSIPNVLTGLPDLDETSFNMPEYLKFFDRIAELIFQKLSKTGYAIFIQTDRKYCRSWVDKSHLLTKVANRTGLKTIFHKIVLLRDPDKTNIYRPGYAHLLCYANESMTTGKATPDVIPVSKKLYRNGTPTEAAKRALQFIKLYSKAGPNIVDPFIGIGTVALLANQMGLNCIGIDIDPNQVCLAKKKIKDSHS